jgi:hypothetical protein
VRPVTDSGRETHRLSGTVDIGEEKDGTRAQMHDSQPWR